MTTATLLLALITTAPTHLGEAGDQPIMLDFTASWCGPCRQMRPVVEQLIGKGYPIKAVDIEQSPDLAERYQVTGIPAFIVIDPSTGRELGRTEGARPADELATLYRQAQARFRPAARAGNAHEKEREKEQENEKENDNDSPAEAERPARNDDTESARSTTPTNPRPWETVVRIKVHGNGSIGFGSGTVIYSTGKETLILTCAHIFKLENGPTPPPSRFPRKITVDLFDGSTLGGPQRNQVHYANETFEGEAIDYDFSRDVGLLRIRPGRRLPYARVVPPHWKPKANMGVITVGCSEGHDATAWSTVVVNPNMKGLNGNRTYEAIECMVAPKQGRSGGGLFTSDGYVAGVCDFAEPQGNHGLYASPTSIYKILDRNDLVALYAPDRARPTTPGRSQGLMAGNGVGPKRSAQPEYRMQSPDRNDPGRVTLPPPEMLGIKTPVVTASDSPSRNASRDRRTWHPTRTAALKTDPSADSDKFGTSELPRESDAGTSDRREANPETPTEPEPVRRSAGRWKAGREPLAEMAPAGQ